ncbi:hypothetical protein [Streptomyces sp. SAJ15]|uniref:hypothetical protein n=1 Tax=Streptomyces sp. SAJ15 TaxID=2011095 RepID=UPI00118623DA|nr:hypothetical protein [Streptomyces sp. SAJ15]TVL87957.1 hypothetical protein CD790_31825 [Streptomyces sp. SAJ15]
MSLGGDDGYGGDGYGGDAGRSGGGHLTRTRLPEGDADAFGSPRRGARTAKPSRNLITVVSVVVLLIAAIAFANRGGGSGDSDSDGSSGGRDPKAQSTAPTGERPVSGKDTATGIATGFAQSEQGAQSAAANYAVALGSAEMFRTESRRAIVGTIYAPGTAETKQSDLDKVYTDKDLLGAVGLKPNGDVPEGMTFVSRTTPVGARAEKFEGDTASVAVWCSSLLGMAGTGSTNPVSENWYTRTFELKWINGDWKITGVTQKDGPTPVGRDQAASSAEEMADAVQGFGGFTYAR